MKYHIKTFGCQMNFSDSERIAAFLDSQEFTQSSNIKKARLAIFNTCGVRQTAENRVYSQVHNLRKNNPEIKIVLTGCVAHRKDVQRKLKDKVDFFFPISKFEVFEDWIIKNWKLEIPTQKNITENQNYLYIKPKYKNLQSISVPIMTGCNNFCSYCVVPYARNREWSRPIEDIFSEIETATKNGCKEVLLLGQNVNSYTYIFDKSKIKNLKLFTNYKLQITNSEQKIYFSCLLDSLATSFCGVHFKFLTSHPKDFSERLMQVIAKNNNISREIHLPIQAGSNKILAAMNRPYTREHYLDLIEKARKIIPEVSFTTDVIVGFPGETEQDFQKTVEVFEKVGYSEAYINKYSPRPGTAAEKLGDPISWDEKKRREKVLREKVQ